MFKPHNGLDTSILVSLISKNHLQNEVVTSKIWQLRQDEHRLIVSPHCLVEFYVVATRPTDVNGLGMDVNAAFQCIHSFEQLFYFIGETDSIFLNWKTLIQGFSLKGKVAHDAKLVAWMKVNGIDTIYTLNQKDFIRMGINTISV